MQNSLIEQASRGSLRIQSDEYAAELLRQGEPVIAAGPGDQQTVGHPPSATQAIGPKIINTKQERARNQ